MDYLTLSTAVIVLLVDLLVDLCINWYSALKALSGVTKIIYTDQQNMLLKPYMDQIAASDGISPPLIRAPLPGGRAAGGPISK